MSEVQIDKEATEKLHRGYEESLEKVRTEVIKARAAFKDAERVLAYWERAERLHVELDCHHLSVAMTQAGKAS